MRLDSTSRASFAETARVWAQRAYHYRRAHYRLTAWAEARFGSHGPLISGVVREHFPDPVKDALRRLARLETHTMDASRKAWRTAGKQRATWFRMVDGLGRA